MKKAACAILILLSLSSAFPEDLTGLIPGLGASDFAQLHEGKPLIFENDSSLDLFSRLASRKLTSSGDLNTSIGDKIECLLFINDKSTDIDGYFSRMHGISALEGLQYYSRSAKAVKTLIKASYRVDDTDKKTKIADLVPSSDYSRYTIFQNDKSFGANTYKVAVAKEADRALMVIRNISPMNILIVTVFKPDKFESCFSVVKTDTGYLFYAAFFFKPEFSFGMDKNIRESLQNRLIAFSRWLSGTEVSQ